MVLFLCACALPLIHSLYYSCSAIAEADELAGQCHSFERVWTLLVPFTLVNAMMLAMAALAGESIWYCGAALAASVIFLLGQTSPYIQVCFVIYFVDTFAHFFLVHCSALYRDPTCWFVESTENKDGDGTFRNGKPPLFLHVSSSPSGNIQ